MRTNWKKVGIEIEMMKIPDDIIQIFKQDGDAGKFRNACRKFNIDEAAIDAKIHEIEDD